MNSKVPKWLFLAPLIYLGIIGFFINLHFADGESVFSQSVGPLHVEAGTSGGVDREYESVEVSFFGFTLDFPGGIPVEGEDGESRVIPVVTVEVLDSSIRLQGKNGASLNFSLGSTLGAGVFQFPDAYPKEEGTAGVLIDWTPPEDEGGAAARFSLLSSYRTQRIDEEIPLYSMVGESESYLCTAGGSPEVEAKLDEEGQLSLRLGGDNAEGRASGCIIAPYEGDNPLRHWFFGDSEAEGATAYNELFEQWREGSFEGWESRYDSGESSWRKGDSGMSSFESIITAYAAESMRRNSTTGIDNFSEAMDAYGGRNAFFSSPYLGNIMSTDEEHSRLEETRAGDIREYVDNNSPELFAEEENLIRFFIWYGDESLANDFDEYAAALELSSFEESDFEESEAVVRFFSIAVEAADKYPERFPGLSGRIDDIYSHVLGRLVRVGNTPLLPTAESDVDAELTLVLAHTLMSYGEMTENSLALDLGSTMGVKVLEEMEEDGFLPSSFDIEGGDVLPRRAELAPEKVYPLLASNRFYPHLVSLSDELDSDVRLWTSAQSVGASRDGDEITITLNFVDGETHYVAVRGIPSFSRFNLYGMRWGSDRRFQTYAVGGWYYEEDRRTLYAKLRHKDQTESLEMEGADS
ncbi:MAG: hypothetical protein ACLFMZ_08650 [Spirochaetaceae bacterium]